MKWLLIVVAVGTADAAPVDQVRSSMAARIHAAYTEWSLTRDVRHGVSFATRAECRKAIHALATRGPDPESAPLGRTTFRAFCKLQGDKS